jgi:hypothetical protein
MAKAISIVVFDPEGKKEGETFPPNSKYGDGKLQDALIEEKQKRQTRRINKLQRGDLQ